MKVKLDRQDLINLVNGTSPNQSVNGSYLMDRYGKFCDNRGWTWNEYELKDNELYEIYIFCKKSWN